MVGEYKEIKFASNNSPFEFEHQSHDHRRSRASRAAVLFVGNLRNALSGSSLSRAGFSLIRTLPGRSQASQR